MTASLFRSAWSVMSRKLCYPAAPHQQGFPLAEIDRAPAWSNSNSMVNAAYETDTLIALFQNFIISSFVGDLKAGRVPSTEQRRRVYLRRSVGLMASARPCIRKHPHR